MKGTLQGVVCTLANKYCPNKNTIGLLIETLEKLMEFKKGKIILAGDLNICMDPQVDSTQRALGIGSNKLRRLKNKLYQCQLVHVLRAQHPRRKDYYYYFTVHRSTLG